MKVINITQLKAQAKKHLDECEQSNEPLMVTTSPNAGGNQQMIIVSKAQYDMMIGKINEHI